MAAWNQKQENNALFTSMSHCCDEAVFQVLLEGGCPFAILSLVHSTQLSSLRGDQQKEIEEGGISILKGGRYSSVYLKYYSYAF